jgi:hypothetical protein
MSDRPISKQTFSHSPFLGTSPSGLRQSAIRCLLRLGLDGLELAAQARARRTGMGDPSCTLGRAISGI